MLKICYGLAIILFLIIITMSASRFRRYLTFGFAVVLLISLGGLLMTMTLN